MVGFLSCSAASLTTFQSVALLWTHLDPELSQSTSFSPILIPVQSYFGSFLNTLRHSRVCQQQIFVYQLFP